MKRLLNILTSSLLIYLFIVPTISANSPPSFIEAEGSATIISGDLTEARRIAINQASEIATRQASAVVSASTRMQDGQIISDNVRFSSSGILTDLTILEERLQGNELTVRIKAKIKPAQSCPGGLSEVAYQRNIGFTAFPMVHPAQANAGGLHEMPVRLPELLARELKQFPGFNTHTATHLQIHPHLDNAPTQMLDDGTLTNFQRGNEQTNMQFIVSGVIRDIRQRNPQGAREPLLVTDLFHRLDPNHERNLRAFIMDVYVHDAVSGGLVWQNRYMTAGIWNARQTRTGFATDAFWQQDYGDKVRREMRQVVADLNDRLRCEPFTARITRAEQNRIWINAGSLSGLNSGDRLSVLRRQIHYNSMNEGYPEFVPTQVSVTLDRVEPTFASGTLNTQASHANIQRDDLVRSQ